MSELYLGLRAPKREGVIPFPVIKIQPLSDEAEEWSAIKQNLDRVTNLIFTSQTAVEIFCQHCSIATARVLAVGEKTQRSLEKRKIPVAATAKPETAEGIIALLEKEHLKQAFVLWPHSALSRTLISDYLTIKEISHLALAIYETVSHFPGPLPDTSSYERITFTSPSTVDAFFLQYPGAHREKELHCIGPVTEARLKALLEPLN